MPFTTAAKNTMLGAITTSHIRLHSGAPGGSGTDNELGAGRSAATFASASGGERLLQSDVLVTGLTPSQSVTHFSVWSASSGGTFQGWALITGDTNANSAGEYTLKATTTKLALNDPA